MKNGVSKVYLDRPDYADFDSSAKFEAIKSIIAKRLREHPNAICSYSGGADSDIMIDLIEQTRKTFDLPPVKYVFFNTGLEMKATKDHVKRTAEKYGVEIEECRPKINIVQASRKYGIPFVSKIMSGGLSEWQKKGIPLCIADEYDRAEDKAAKRQELRERYPKSFHSSHLHSSHLHSSGIFIKYAATPALHNALCVAIMSKTSIALSSVL